MATGQTLVGGAGNDTLTGGPNDDVISGLGGDDSLIGGEGNDSIAGGDGNDRIFPGIGMDTVDGGDGNDWIDLDADGGSTSQSVHGGSGDDTIFSSNVNSIKVFGDDGNDTLTLFRGSIDGGAGNDTLKISDGTVVGGAGQDRIIISGLYNFTPGVIEYSWAVTITGFTGGSGGDTLDLTNVLTQLSGYSSGDPFGRYFWLEQSSGNTLLRVDRDMAGMDYSAETVATFQGIFINDLTAANFVGGFTPTSTKSTADATVTGTAANDTLAGGWGNDTISGGGGNDRITDLAGTNSLSGGAGDDYLFTSNGVLDGGDGNDALQTQGGANTMNGGAGNDSILGGNGNDSLTGGDGDDTLDGLAGTDQLDGGAGNDQLTVSTGQATLHGGLGNDTLIGNIAFNSTTATALLYGDDGDDILRGHGATLDGGAGSDRFEVISGVATGGSGADTFSLSGVQTVNARVGQYNLVHTTTITDFNAAQGDKIDLQPSLINMLAYQGGNPFGTTMWLTQDGNDTLLMVDPDAGLSNLYNDAAPTALVRLQNVQASSLTASAFVQGFTPSLSSPYAGLTLTGGAGNDYLAGKLGADSLSGGDGSDLLYGNAGNDVLNGGNGIDAVRYLTALGNGVTIQQPGGSGLSPGVTGTEGTDTLTNVEIGIFNNKIVPLLAPTKWTPNQPYDHTLFDESAYLAMYTDVAQAVARDQFSSGEAHYLMYGKNEGRIAPAKAGAANVLFDNDFYLRSNPDVANAVSQGVITSAWTHFVQFGEKEGRDPNTLFDTDWYLATNPDVAAAVATGGIDALSHYALYGWKEGRDPSRWFDTSAYLASNPDVAAAGVNPLLHYLGFGYYEGRTLTFTETLT